jgi:EmrB/QacA subfamily drug resistance transporter
MDARVDQSEVRFLTHQEARLIVFGMLLPVFMSSLDNTILASALPTIGREFGDMRSLPWLITMYMLAATAIVPLYGKIADIRGRQFTLRIAICGYIAGSLVCALAPNMMVLIFGRALHGLGGGGLASMGAVILGDVVAPKERGRYYAYFAIAYTTAGASGPALGGFLSDYIHWSAIFWMNVPLGLTALAITSRLLRRLPRHERPHRLDVVGAALIVMASVSFMLGLNLGGKDFSWLSPPILLLFATALVVGALFIWRLLTAPEPLIPIAILRSPTVRCCVTIHAFGWSSIAGLNIFLPMYLQNVVGLSPTNAGLSLMMLMIALNISAGTSGYFLGRMIRYKLLPTCALTVSILATIALALWVDRLSLLWFEILLTLIGIGFGPAPGLSQVALQNSVERHQLGISVGTMNFCRNLLGTMLIALFGAIVAGTASVTTGGVAAGALDGILNPEAALAAEAFRRVFFMIAGTLTVALVAVLLLEEKPLQTGVAPEIK